MFFLHGYQDNLESVDDEQSVGNRGGYSSNRIYYVTERARSASSAVRNKVYGAKESEGSVCLDITGLQ